LITPEYFSRELARLQVAEWLADADAQRLARATRRQHRTRLRTWLSQARHAQRHRSTTVPIPRTRSQSPATPARH